VAAKIAGDGWGSGTNCGIGDAAIENEDTRDDLPVAVTAACSGLLLVVASARSADVLLAVIETPPGVSRTCGVTIGNAV
jgi:hypothetical protein